MKTSTALPYPLRALVAAVPLYGSLTAMWARQPSAPLSVPTHTPMWAYRLHLYNFRLWHAEDGVRRPGASDAFIATSKRTIDAFNQQRHDQIEHLDGWLFHLLYGADLAPASVAELHSETPSNLLDRLSILTLKRYYMGYEAQRADASAAHRRTCGQRLAVIQAQHEDLSGCLTRLCHDLHAGRKRFQVYHQFKMYNDPELNPAIYRHR